MNTTILKNNLLPQKSVLVYLIALILCAACQDKQSETKDVAITPQMSDVTVESKAVPKKIVLFFGNSLTAGYGLDEDQSFPSLIQNRFDSLDLPYQAVNAGLSGETTADGQNRIDWVLRQPMDIFVLELGANDMLRGLDLEQTEKNLSTIIDKVRAKHPDIPIILTGMQAPPNLGSDYTSRFADIFPRLARKYNIGLVPFLLEGVAGQPDLNLDDLIHPNADGSKILMENVWPILSNYLK